MRKLQHQAALKKFIQLFGYMQAHKNNKNESNSTSKEKKGNKVKDVMHIHQKFHKDFPFSKYHLI